MTNPTRLRCVALTIFTYTLATFPIYDINAASSNNGMPPKRGGQLLFLNNPILNFFIKSRTTLFKSFRACYKLIKQ